MVLSTSFFKKPSDAEPPAPAETATVDRAALVEELAEIQKQRDARAAEVKRLAGEVENAELALDAARKAWHAAGGKHQYTVDARRDEIHRELIATAPPEIDAAIQQLQAQIAEFSNFKRTNSRGGFTGPITLTSNVPAIEQHMLAARAAIRQLCDLKSVALDDRALAREIKTIVGSVKAPSLEMVSAGGH